MSRRTAAILRIFITASLFSCLLVPQSWSQTSSSSVAKVSSESPHKPLTAAQRKVHYKKIAKKISELLSDPDAARGFWGIDIVSLSSGKPIYAQDADKLFTPASNAKLFTTAAALAMLGPDYRYHTTIETSGSIDNQGRLKSDLILVGRGDPN